MDTDNSKSLSVVVKGSTPVAIDQTHADLAEVIRLLKQISQSLQHLVNFGITAR